MSFLKHREKREQEGLTSGCIQKIKLQKDVFYTTLTDRSIRKGSANKYIESIASCLLLARQYLEVFWRPLNSRLGIHSGQSKGKVKMDVS